MKKVRESNFELMRIVSMIFIILCHTIVHGHIIENSHSQSIDTIFGILKHIIIIHVNSFIIVLGYFQCRSNFKLSKTISLIFQTLFYSIVIFLVMYKFNYFDVVNFTMIMNVLIPFTSYWFISAYLITYILSDYINMFLNVITHKQLKKILILCFFIFSVLPFFTGMKFMYNDGYNFYHFIYLYILGAYLYKYPLKNNYIFKRFSLNGYRLFLIVIFLLCATYNYFLYDFAMKHLYDCGQVFNYISNVILSSDCAYSSPIVIIQTVCYFEFFKSLNIKSKVINFISSCVFGIYLFHDNWHIRGILYKILRIDTGAFYGRKIFLYVFIAVIIIFFVGLLIEIIRKLLAKLIVKTPLYKKIRMKFYNYIKSFNG